MQTLAKKYKILRIFFWITDIGFILYWTITILKLLPEEYLFKDYHNPILMAWNWSFLPLDLCISLSGFYSIYLQNQNDKNWNKWALVSLVLTSCSGLQAISFWLLRNDLDITWWLPNLYLLVYPIYFIFPFQKSTNHSN
jgi:hypothetical protein